MKQKIDSTSKCVSNTLFSHSDFTDEEQRLDHEIEGSWITRDSPSQFCYSYIDY